MAVIKVLRTGQITLPADLRRRLRLDEGAYLEATEVDGGILLRPVAEVDRGGGWQRVLAVVDQDKWKGGEPRPDPDQEEEQIYALIAEFRKNG